MPNNINPETEAQISSHQQEGSCGGLRNPGKCVKPLVPVLAAPKGTYLHGSPFSPELDDKIQETPPRVALSQT